MRKCTPLAVVVALACVANVSLGQGVSPPPLFYYTFDSESGGVIPDAVVETTACSMELRD